MSKSGAAPRGLSRLLAPVLRQVSVSWHLYPVGFLFGLGFDTASEISLLGLSIVQTQHGLPIWQIMMFPLLFTAGMAAGHGRRLLFPRVDGASLEAVTVNISGSIAGEDRIEGRIACAPDTELLVINKIDLAPYVGADLGVMDRDSRKMRGTRLFVFANIRAGEGVPEIVRFIVEQGGL